MSLLDNADPGPVHVHVYRTGPVGAPQTRRHLPLPGYPQRWAPRHVLCARGEPITIDANEETARELETFLEAFGQAVGARSRTLLEVLVDRDATPWSAGGAVRQQHAVVRKLLELDPGTVSEVEWLVGTGRWEAVCSAQGTTADGTPATTPCS